MNVIQQLEKEQQKDKVPALRAGDTVKVHAKVVEGGLGEFDPERFHGGTP